MKVVCINNSKTGRFSGGQNTLTISKAYECIKSTFREHSPGGFTVGEYYLILLDNGDTTWFLKSIFTTLEEYRNKRLKELGI